EQLVRRSTPRDRLPRRRQRRLTNPGTRACHCHVEHACNTSDPRVPCPPRLTSMPPRDLTTALTASPAWRGRQPEGPPSEGCGLPFSPRQVEATHRRSP